MIRSYRENLGLSIDTYVQEAAGGESSKLAWWCDGLKVWADAYHAQVIYAAIMQEVSSQAL